MQLADGLRLGEHLVNGDLYALYCEGGEVLEAWGPIPRSLLLLADGSVWHDWVREARARQPDRVTKCVKIGRWAAGQSWRIVAAEGGWLAIGGSARRPWGGIESTSGRVSW